MPAQKLSIHLSEEMEQHKGLVNQLPTNVTLMENVMNVYLHHIAMDLQIHAQTENVNVVTPHLVRRPKVLHVVMVYVNAEMEMHA